MRVKFKTRDGDDVEFEKKKKVHFVRQGESYITSLVRTYYPSDYRRHQKMRKAV